MTAATPEAKRRPLMLALLVTVVALAFGFAAAGTIALPRLDECLPSLALAVAVTAAASGWGQLATRWTCSRDPRTVAALRGLPEVLIGLGVLEASAFVVGVTGAIGRLSSMLVLGTGIALAVAREIREWRSPRLSRLGWLAVAPMAVATLPVLLTGLLAALPPPSWFDALEYHLTIPATYVLEGRMVEMPDNFFSHLPHGIALIDTLVLGMQPTLGLAPLHWLYGVLATLAVARLAARQVHRAAGPLSAALFLTFNEAALSLSAIGVDLALAASLVVAAELLLAARDHPPLWLPACAIGGIGATFKVHGIAHIAALLAASLLLRRITRGSALAPAASLRVMIAPALALVLPLLPWGLINFARHGNPAYPFLSELFAGPAEDGTWIAWIAAYTRDMGVTGGALAAVPRECLRRLFEPGEWQPVPLVLLALPVLVRDRGRRLRPLALALFAALSLLTWFLTAPVARYALVPVALLSAATAGVLVTALALTRTRRWRGPVLSVVTMVLTVAALHACAKILRSRDPLPWLLASESSAGFSERSVEASPAALFAEANATLPATARVLSLDEPRMYGLWRRFTAATVFDRRALWRFSSSTSPRPAAAAVAAAMLDAGYTHILVDSGFTDHTLLKVSSPYRYGDADRALIAALLGQHARPVLHGASHRLYAITPTPPP